MKPPEYRHGQKLSIGIGIKKTVAEGILILTAACGIGQAKTPTRPISPTPEGLGGTPTQTWTPTEAATATKTATPTEIPLFTEAEIKAMNPFDTSKDLATWPKRFAETQLHPELATEQQLQDEYQFVLAGRADKGILQTADYKDHISPYYQSAWNCMKWEQENLDKVKEEQLKCQLHPYEIKAMYEDRKIAAWTDENGAFNGIKGFILPPDEPYQYDSDNLGQIAGLKNVDSEAYPINSAFGKFAGIGEIGGQTVILIDMKDKDGYHVLVPIAVYIEKGVTLPAGSGCLVTEGKYVEQHNGNSIFTLPSDVELGPLRENGSGKVVDWETLFANIGKEVWIIGGGYRGELSDKTGITAIYGFSPELNLQIASTITFATKDINSSPWTEQ